MEKRMEFIIEGKYALMTHNPASMTKKKDKTPTKGTTVVFDPVEEAEAGTYIFDGKYCFPSIGVRNAIIRAAGEWKPLSGKKRGTLTTTVAHIVIEPELVPILDSQNKPVKKYEIDERRVVVQRQGITRSRPKFPEWRLAFEIVYDEEILPRNEEEVRQMFTGLLDDAGRRIGLGEYRPAKSGWFGTFRCLANGTGKSKK